MPKKIAPKTCEIALCPKCQSPNIIAYTIYDATKLFNKFNKANLKLIPNNKLVLKCHNWDGIKECDYINDFPNTTFVEDIAPIMPQGQAIMRTLPKILTLDLVWNHFRVDKFRNFGSLKAICLSGNDIKFDFTGEGAKEIIYKCIQGVSFKAQIQINKLATSRTMHRAIEFLSSKKYMSYPSNEKIYYYKQYPKLLKII